MRTRKLGFRKSFWVAVMAIGAVFPAPAHFVYDGPGSAAHNLEHLAPSFSLILLALALAATTLYCVRRK